MGGYLCAHNLGTIWPRTMGKRTFLTGDEKLAALAALERLVTEKGSGAEAARALASFDGPTQQAVSAALKGGPIGPDFARALARYNNFSDVGEMARGVRADVDVPPNVPAPVAAAVRWARAAGYPQEFIDRAIALGRRGPPLTFEQQIQKVVALKVDYDAGVLAESEREPVLSEPRRGRKRR